MMRTSSATFFACLISLAGCNSSIEPFVGPAATLHDQNGGDGRGNGSDHPLHPDTSSLRVFGTILEVPSRGGSAAFLLETDPQQLLWGTGNTFTLEDRYHVFLTDRTAIRTRGETGPAQAASLEAIRVGAYAEVHFVGPIRESYPAQGTAGGITILIGHD